MAKLYLTFRLDCHRRKCQAKTDVGERAEGRAVEVRVAEGRVGEGRVGEGRVGEGSVGEECPHREAGCTWRGGPQQLSRYLKCTTSSAVSVPDVYLWGVHYTAQYYLKGRVPKNTEKSVTFTALGEGWGGGWR